MSPTWMRRRSLKTPRPKTQDAVIRNLTIIGEAAGQVFEPFMAAHPEIPWQQMAGMRNILVHRYFGVDLGEVWQTATGDLPGLRNVLAPLLP